MFTIARDVVADTATVVFFTPLAVKTTGKAGVGRGVGDCVGASHSVSVRTVAKGIFDARPDASQFFAGYM
jgi:hypothetical protein